MEFGTKYQDGLKITTNALGNSDDTFPFRFHECGDCSHSEDPYESSDPSRLWCQNLDCLVDDTHSNWTPAQAHEQMEKDYLDVVECQHDELGVSCYSPRQGVVDIIPVLVEDPASIAGELSLH